MVSRDRIIKSMECQAVKSIPFPVYNRKPGKEFQQEKKRIQYEF